MAAYLGPVEPPSPDQWSVRPTTLGGVVVDVAGAALVVVLTGLAISLLLTFADVMARERWALLHQLSLTWCPAWGRRLVLTVCGVGMVLPSTAGSSVADERDHGDCQSSCTVHVDGLPMPDLPARPRSSPDARTPALVVVRPGDCLGPSPRARLAGTRPMRRCPAPSMPGTPRTPGPSGLIPT